jgi:hypothetical protein
MIDATAEAQQQEEEAQALAAIYGEDFVDRRTPRDHLRCFEVSVAPQVFAAQRRQRPLLLRVVCPREYPRVPPLVELASPDRWLAKDALAALA